MAPDRLALDLPAGDLTTTIRRLEALIALAATWGKTPTKRTSTTTGRFGPSPTTRRPPMCLAHRIAEKLGAQFLDDAAPHNGMMSPPNSEMIAPPIGMIPPGRGATTGAAVGLIRSPLATPKEDEMPAERIGMRDARERSPAAARARGCGRCAGRSGGSPWSAVSINRSSSPSSVSHSPPDRSKHRGSCYLDIVTVAVSLIGLDKVRKDQGPIRGLEKQEGGQSEATTTVKPHQPQYQHPQTGNNLHATTMPPPLSIYSYLKV